MNPRHATTALRSTLFLAAVALSALALRPLPLFAATNACSLVKAADVTALFGGAATQKPTPGGTSCSWIGADGKHKLAVLEYRNRPGVPADMMYMGARKNAEGEDGKATDEAGIGDRAFSLPVSFGVVFISMKAGRVIQLQYYTGGHGTAKDVAALRPIVRKAVAAF